MTTASTAFPWRRAGLACAIAIAAVLAYGPALRGAWLWDDGLEIASNPMVHSSQGWWRGWTAPEGMDYFPVKGMVQWAEWHLWGPRTLGYHAAGLLLHLIAGLLVWRLLGRLGVSFGWLAAAVFVLHPVAVESVAWIAELKTTLSAVLLLLAATAYVDSEADGGSGEYGLSVGAFVLALLSKSTGVMLPVVLLLWALGARGRIERRDLLRLSPFFAASLGLGLVTLSFQGSRAIGAGGPLPPLGERVGQAGWSVWAYLGSAVCPVGLSPIYGTMGAQLPPWLPWLLLAALALGLWALGGAWRRLGLVGLTVFVVLLLPVLGVLPMSYLRVAPRADHLAYLGLVPAAGLIAVALGALLGSPVAWRRWTGAAVAAGLLASFGTLTWIHAGIFRNSRALWSEAVRRNPESWLAQANLGKALLDEGDAAGAVRALDVAVRLRADSAEAWLDRSNAYRALGDKAEAEHGYRKALQLDPSLAGGYYDLGVLLLDRGDAAGGAEALREALRRDTRHAAAHNELGLALARLGSGPAARAEFESALAIDPRNREARLNLGNYFARAGRPDDAIAQYRMALAIDPGYAAARANMEAVQRAYPGAGGAGR